MGHTVHGRGREPSERDGTVLYIDDSADRERTVRHLETVCDGVTVESVGDLTAALAALSERSYDCVVVELAVSERPIDAVTAAVVDAAPETPVVVYTRLDMTTLPSEMFDRVTTVIQRDEAIHRRFLGSKVLSLLSESAATERTHVERLRATFGDETGTLVSCDADGQVSHLSTPLADLFPVTVPDGPLPDRLEAVFANGPELRARLEAAWEADEVLPGYVGELAGDDERYYACWSLPVTGGGEQVVFLRDVTAALARRERLEKLETLVELAHDGLFTTDATGHIEYCNAAFAEMLGYDHDELVGKHSATILRPDSLRDGQKSVQQVLENPEEPSQVLEQVFERKDGDTITLATQTAVRTRGDDTFAGLVNVARDDRGRKERERKLLDQRERLREENERLADIARAVGEDFREPLTTAKRALDEDGDVDTERVRTALDRIGERVDEILEMTRGQETDPSATLEGFVDSIGDGFEPAHLAGPDDYYLAYRETTGGAFEQSTLETSDDESTDDEGGRSETDEGPTTEEETGSPDADEDIRLTVLHVDGSATARERVGEALGSEPDIEVKSVDSADAAVAALREDAYGCLVADVGTLSVGLEAFEETVVAAAPSIPLAVFTAEPSRAVYERLVDETATVVEKGDETNRSFLVEKVRSLTGIGQPGDVDITWQTGRPETMGTPGDAVALVVEDGDVTAVSGDLQAVFGSGVTRERFHEESVVAVTDGDALAKWRQSEPATATHLCELSAGSESRFLRCWRTRLDGRTLEWYRDVTDEIDRHERLQRAETLVENARDGIEVLNQNAEVAYCNEAFANFFGFERSELIGRNLTQYFEPESLRRGQQAVQDLLEDPEMNYVAQDLDHLTRSGEPFTLSYHYTLTPLDEDGSYTGIMCVARDITERKERERELRRREAELRRKNDLLENFGSVLCHELRNPLTIAQNYLELAITDDVAHLSTAREAVVRMEEILTELLAFVRMGEEITDREQVDLAALAERVWAGLDTGDARLVVTRDAPTTLPADDGRLATMLDCLFRNSLEHATAGTRGESDDSSERGDSPVTVEVGGSPDGFYVADDGAGIPADERDAVFEYRYSTTQEYGLGLVVVRDAVRAHGWTVDITESASGGARFDISTNS